MKTDRQRNFRRWMFIKCVDNSKIWADDQNYSFTLSKDKIYFVRDRTNKYGGLRNGPLCVRVNGSKRWHKSSNFVKSSFFRWILSLMLEKYKEKKRYKIWKKKLTNYE